MKVYLHFEDWSAFLWMLEGSTLPIGNRIIKVFATPSDPREIFGNQEIVTVEGDGTPFKSDISFEFSNGNFFWGYELEQALDEKKLDEQGKVFARALFRFSFVNGFTNAAMTALEHGEPIIKNPIEVVDWKVFPRFNHWHLHLDIFFEKSLQDLLKIVDYNNKALLVDGMTGSRWRGKK